MARKKNGDSAAEFEIFDLKDAQQIGDVSEEVPQLPLHIQQFVMLYVVSESNNEKKSQDYWADQFGVHVNTIQRWLRDDDVKQFIRVLQTRLFSYFENAIRMIQKRTLEKWLQLIEATSTDDLEAMRKIVFGGVALLRGYTGSLDGESAFSSTERTEHAENLSVDEIKARIRDIETVDRNIDADALHLDSGNGNGEKRKLKTLADIGAS